MSETTVEPPAGLFWASLNEGDIDRAFSLVDDDAPVSIHALGTSGSAKDARRYFEDTFRAFPDVQFRAIRTFTTAGGGSVTELSMEGTQAAEYQGVINQEKHCDVDQVWILDQAAGRITGIKAYWCQSQLYRRLAVKRLDQISIV